MKKKSGEDYLDKLLNSVNDEKMRKEKFKETAKSLEDAVHFWESEREALDFEDAVYMQATEEEQKESGQEDFLDSLLKSAENTEFGMNRKKNNPKPMYSRRVSRSEADFLREFEAELAQDFDDLSGLFGQFEETVEPEDRLEAEDIQINKQEADSVTLGDVDLDSLVDEAAGVMGAVSMTDSLAQEAPVVASDANDVPLDDFPEDVFQDLLGGADGLNLAEGVPEQPVSDSLNLAESVPEQLVSEGIDLGDLGEADLMNLLAGTDDLSDIGDLLSQSDSAEVPLDELDAFAAFAENEMSVQQVSAEPVEEEVKDGKKNKNDKKGGLIGKLKSIFGNMTKDDVEDEVELKAAKPPTAEALSGENADILAELEGLEEKSSKKKDKKEKKKKEKKEKKPKKAKAPKKPKTPKPKKEKKPKEVDNTPKLPRGPVIMIWLMVASLFALVLIGVNFTGYNSQIANAKSLMNSGHYAEAFAEVDGLKIKEKDLELYDQLAILATVDSELNAYNSFEKNEVEDKAFDSLICAAGRCEINWENADVYGCLGQLEILKRTVSNELEQKYGVTYEEAIELYTIPDRDDYTIALYKKLRELGIDWE